ncbi:hypothetical protein [Bacillus pumilus]|uniref:hypothetical protein n=1 Tax=Bacillus pumilus TaxID=1408 RepID=UPI00227FD2F3|nr:hypothetical protein [Bacillus pumilus]MCY7500209.1 hypothetical protein [Bacillus pumilus]MCY7528467.1 hypothetical protein [Bacillus pumilus]MED4441490.1 hypothetical protein [Bacillus pumilus]MED4490018.1 hypothetical protein [Bacillus pumilus]
MNIYNMRVRDLLNNVAIGTKVKIENGVFDIQYFDGTVKDYLSSDIAESERDLKVFCVRVFNDTLIIQAVNYS